LQTFPKDGSNVLSSTLTASSPQAAFNRALKQAGLPVAK
jgi:hypothetical protein